MKSRRMTAIFMAVLMAFTFSLSISNVQAQDMNAEKNNTQQISETQNPKLSENLNNTDENEKATEGKANGPVLKNTPRLGSDPNQTESLNPSPATENQLNEAGTENDYQIKFQRKDETVQEVKFTDPGAQLGLNGTPYKTGFSIFAKYFIGWSDNKDYISQGKGHLFYNTATVKEVKDAGIKSGSTLYALYAGAFVVSNMQNLTKITINDEVAGNQFVNAKNAKKENDTTTVTYNKNKPSYDITTLNATFKMNPFVAAAVYKDPWVGALDNGSDWGALGNNGGKFTVVDLHLTLDKRLKLPDEFEISFHSYTFRPFSIRSAINPDNSPVEKNKQYPYLGVDQGGDEPGQGVINRVKDNEPTTTFKTKSYLLNASGEKVPVYDYIIRTRTRVGYDKKGNKIAPITMEQIQSDMKIALSNSKFHIPHKLASDISEGKEDPIKFSGFVDGLVKGVSWGTIKSEEEILQFKKPLKVNFFNGDEKYDSVDVEEDNSINGDDLKDQVMPKNPTKKGYIFKEWNTQKDGKGTTFTGDTIVKDNLDVYAIYKIKDSTPGKKPNNKSKAKGNTHNPETGDNSALPLYITLSILSIGFLTLAILKRKREINMK